MISVLESVFKGHSSSRKKLIYHKSIPHDYISVVKILNSPFFASRLGLETHFLQLMCVLNASAIMTVLEKLLVV